MNDIKYIGNKINKSWVKSFKQLCNNPKPLTKKIYKDHVLQNIDDYYLTDKADGIRCFLILSGTNVKYVTSEKNIFPKIRWKNNNEYIFDCEYINNTGFIFDVIVYKSMNVSSQPFYNRLKYINEFNTELEDNKFIKIKRYHKLSISNYQATILNVYKARNPQYKLDGLIFTESKKDYNHTDNFKWKPVELLTIDFMAIKVGTNKYILTVGITDKLAKHFNLNVGENFPIRKKEGYIPVPFYNSLKPNIYHYSSNMNLNNRIVELSLDKNKKWKFHRIRHDREVEVKHGTYYGNNYKTAETNLQLILNPLTLKELTYPFTIPKHTTIPYKDEVDNLKGRLFKKYKSDSIMILSDNSNSDEDFMRCVNVDFNNILILENNADAIEKIIERKYHAPIDKNFNLISLAVEMDFSKTPNNIIKNIEKDLKKSDKFMDIYQGKCDVIFCNLAMQYFMESEHAIGNIADFVSHFLNDTGVFIMIILDEQYIRNAIKKGNNMDFLDKTAYVISENKLNTVLKKHGIVQTDAKKINNTNGMYKYLVYEDVLHVD